jgi:hypothetical protein
MSKAERTPSRPVDCWDVEAIVDTSGGSKEVGRKNPNPNVDERPFASLQTHRGHEQQCTGFKLMQLGPQGLSAP